MGEDDRAIETVEDLVEHLRKFNQEKKLRVTYDSGYGIGYLTYAGIYADNDGKIHIDVNT